MASTLLRSVLFGFALLAFIGLGIKAVVSFQG